MIVSEVNASRRAFGQRLGLQVVDPGHSNLIQVVHDITGGAGADVAFEVSGSAAGTIMMTALAWDRSCRAAALEQLERNPSAMKILVDCRA